jgi:apolipoprotein N-acyltransferase
VRWCSSFTSKALLSSSFGEGIERITGFNGNITGILDLNPAEYAKLVSSPQSHLDEMRQKTLEAVKVGAKIIVWQETALALESSVADTYLMEMKNLADEKDVYLLVSYERLLNETEKKDRLSESQNRLRRVNRDGHGSSIGLLNSTA